MSNSSSWNDQYDAMQDKVDAAIKKFRNGEGKDKFVNSLKRGPSDVVVIYSAYSHDKDDLPTDNLDEIAFEGTFTVVCEKSKYDLWRDEYSQDYKSAPVTNPTWLDLAVLANESIHTTRDFHHVFFEGAEQKDDELYLSFGS